MSLESHGGGVSSGALLQKCNVLNDATLNIASRHFQPAGAGATVVAGAATFGNIQITATNAGDVSGAIINSINAVGNSVKTLTATIGTAGETKNPYPGKFEEIDDAWAVLSVEAMMNEKPEYGKLRWRSLQAAS
eukprot:g7556.t1